MNRRQFLLASTAVPATLVLQQKWARAAQRKQIRPLKAITAAVDTILPADPDIPGDFKASDYGADVTVANKLGALGQVFAVVLLNRYAAQIANKRFTQCSPAQRLEAIKAWIMEKDTLPVFERDLLSGLLSMTSIGTFEQESASVREHLYESMGWYDPADPLGSFRIPCDGYRDFEYPY